MKTPKASVGPKDPAAEFLERHWADILSTIDEGLIIFDAQGRVMFFNPAAEHLTGISGNLARLRPCAQAFRTNPLLADAVQATLRSGAGGAAAEGELSDHSRTRTPVRLLTSAILDAAGAVQGVVLVVHDLSRRRLLEEEMRQKDHLVHLGMVAAGLAHEIKNPLAGIRGAVQLLQQRLRDDSQGADYGEAILREIDRLHALLERLLELGSPPSPSHRPVNIHK